jgi:hypothetical protein
MHGRRTPAYAGQALALGDAGHPRRLDQFTDRTRREALDIGFLDHRSQRLLGHPPTFPKGPKNTGEGRLTWHGVAVVRRAALDVGAITALTTWKNTNEGK